MVTGGAGFIGAVVVRRLIADGYVVRVLDDLSSGRRERLEGVPCEIVVDDIRAERGVREAMQGVDGVIHLAAPGKRPRSPREERLAHDVAVTGTFNLLAAAREAKVARFVFASSASVYGTPKGSFHLHEDLPPQPSSLEGAQKCAAEAYVRMFAAQGLPACVLRVFSAYGPGQDGSAEDAPLVASFLHAAKQGTAMLIYGDGSQTRDLIHVDDVAAAFAAALTAPAISGRVFNVASGEAMTVKQVAAMINDVAGGTLPPVKYLPSRTPATQVRTSIAAANTGLGWKPRIRLREGIAAILGRSGTRAAGRPITQPPASLPPRVQVAPPPVPLPAPRGSAPMRVVSATPAEGTPVVKPAILPPAQAQAAISVVPLFADRPNSWEVPDQDA